MNVVILVGRLTRDPELRTTQGGKSVAKFSVAVDRRYKTPGQPEADFFNVTAWGRQAEVICQYLKKGRQIALQGRLQTGSYVARDGSTRYTTDVVLDNFDFIGGRDSGSGYSGQGSYQPKYNQPGSAQAPPQAAPLEIDDDFTLMADDDEVPF